MFTGIVQGTAEIVEIIEKQRFRTHTVRLPEAHLADLQPGASIAHNGCCLTVVSIDGDRVSFDLMQETLRITNLGRLQTGDRVNYERAARFGDEIGGHSMSGHIICTAEVIEVKESENNRQVWFRMPAALMKYLFSKGYIGIDGISLTIGEVEGDRFNVHLIPETLNRTNMGWRRPGDRVNIEIDPQTQAIVDTVEKVLAENRTLPPTGTEA
ncbi:MAG: riboflavin synthase [Candidatus Sedimenticola endophacoides]|uniref:Riboflavin synthase n=1 Tax=Candidatus Sedimenticola endophacoides TaxID=2548426 RepID=A0A657PWU5_9GAMM|nr:MAG: riboflavin synthase [Candidatus Sedimenticola endophacoides]OQX35063.1 MAG: riboflavin synthase [Candidatus Sedimenticola endophacoides]OQX40404.1 MAG: riboflavin synthase [Candidatus Sedimenticola endophacoides]OQX40706.1 MAG: riboflavin synthase [Candidatus Sedimenticola endophacoides]OQX43114.1 MAG: riboflavin synthase [Candidatus Sedimenticola endophacoides]